MTFSCLLLQYKKLEDGSQEKNEIVRQISETTMHRIHLDGSIELIRKLHRFGYLKTIVGL